VGLNPYNSAFQIKGLAMPIYAYRCASCGHAQDHLQKISDDALTVCPSCGAASYAKQVTAAGFQLKGSGWYVTDFRGGNTAAPAKPGAAAEPAAEKAADKAPAPAADKPAAAPAPAPAAPAAD
jgi:putative FmdB family regulatory protein